MRPTARRTGAAVVSAARVSILVLGLMLPGIASAQQIPVQSAILLEVTGAIGPATTEYVESGLATAAERGAALVILRLDTPGGLDIAMREIIQAILASPVPVVAYVAPSGARAASAGTYILYASHLAAMAPGTNLGAATPVQLGGAPQPLEGEDEDGQDDGEPDRQAPLDAHAAKAVNDAVAYIRGLAELRGRNADWAEQAVRRAASLPASAALERDVIELIAGSVDDLLAQADGRRVQFAGGNEVVLDTTGLRVVPIEPDWRIRFLGVITNPNVAYILLLIGIYGIIFEFASPGMVFPGVIGAICLLVGLFALNLLPVNYAGIGLLALGIILMAAEAFVTSFGALGIGGIIAFAIGSIIMFDSGVPGFELSLPVILAVTAASALLLVVVLAVAVRAHRHKVVTGQELLLGSAGQVTSWSGETGRVLVQGEQWRARSTHPLAPGQRVVVIARENLTLLVEPDRGAEP